MSTTSMIKQAQGIVGVDTDGDAGPQTWKAIYKRIIGHDATTNDLDTIIRAVQKAVHVFVDGDAGSQTWTAILANLTANPANTNPTPVATGDADTQKVDERSERNISTLQPQVQPLARMLVNRAAAAGITIKVISALRTYAEQDELFAQGRTKPGRIVTNARAGFSNHNFGLAFDIGIFEGTDYIEESPRYKTVGGIGKAIGLSWGGDWISIQDEPHFELRPGWASDLSETAMLAVLRERKESGESFFA